MVCAQCSTENQVGSKFCAGCGKPILQTSGHEGARNTGQRVGQDTNTIPFVHNMSRENGSDFNERSMFDLNHLYYLFLSPKGRINRERFIFGYLFLTVCSIMLGVFLEFIVEGLSNFTILSILFYVMLGIKRAHDTDHPGIFIILTFIPFVNLLVLGYFIFASGTVGPNRFGDDPRKEYSNTSTF